MLTSNTPLGPVYANTTPLYTGAQFQDTGGNPIPGASLDTLTLTICDTATGAIINNCELVNILNTNRGTVDSSGFLTIQFEEGDTSMSEVPGAVQVQRSLVLDWTYNGGLFAGRALVNFIVVALPGP